MGLYHDIAIGLGNCKVIVACVSDEYANSAACMMEFEHAITNLQLPMVVAVVGQGSNWNKEESAVSCNVEILMIIMTYIILTFHNHDTQTGRYINWFVFQHQGSKVKLCVLLNGNCMAVNKVMCLDNVILPIQHIDRLCPFDS